MASDQLVSCRWNPLDFVHRQVPAHLIHDLMQPLHAYALAAEQLKLCLKDDSAPKYAAFDELTSMNLVIGELEANLWLLQEFWRLSALEQPPSLLATPLDTVFRTALNRLEKRRPNLFAAVEGRKNDQYVQSSSIWLGTLLSCLFESAIQNTRVGLSIKIQAGEHEIEIRISKAIDEAIDTQAFGLGVEEDVPLEPERSGFALHLATEIAAALKCRLAVNASDISLILPASSTSERQAIVQPDMNALFRGRRIAVFETDQDFSDDLTGLLRGWGCEVMCPTFPDLIEGDIQDGKSADALFVGFDLWQRMGQGNLDFSGHLESTANVFVTVNRDCASEVPAEYQGCTFLPRPFSPIRLRKHLMSLFSPAG